MPVVAQNTMLLGLQNLEDKGGLTKVYHCFSLHAHPHQRRTCDQHLASCDVEVSSELSAGQTVSETPRGAELVEGP